MARVLILYGTTDGQTRKIAATMADALADKAIQVDLTDAKDISRDARPEAYDGVIVLASVHAGGYQRPVKRWVRQHGAALSARPSAFVSVCLGILEKRPEVQRQVRQTVNRFLERSGWQPTARSIVAGALPWSRYGWLKTIIMRRIVAKAGGDTDSSRDYEYTDWNQVRGFARDFGRLFERRPSRKAPELHAVTS